MDGRSPNCTVSRGITFGDKGDTGDSGRTGSGSESDESIPDLSSIPVSDTGDIAGPGCEMSAVGSRVIVGELVTTHG